MAGKRITELPSAGLLQPGDLFPIARGTQTLHVSGQVLATAASIEDVEFTRQKYHFQSGVSTFVVTPSCNNLTVVLSGINMLHVDLANTANDVYKLGTTIRFLSLDQTIDLDVDDYGTFTCFDWPSTSTPTTMNYVMIKKIASIGQYSTAKLQLLYEGIWLFGVDGGSTGTSLVGNNTGTGDTTEAPDTTYDNVNLDGVVIDPTGTVVPLSSISGADYLVTIDGLSSIEAINGQNAYPFATGYVIPGP